MSSHFTSELNPTPSKETNLNVVGTPSPRKKRNNSTPTRKNAAEKRQILQQLISPNMNKKVNELTRLCDVMTLRYDVSNGSHSSSHLTRFSRRFPLESWFNFLKTLIVDPTLHMVPTIISMRQRSLLTGLARHRQIPQGHWHDRRLPTRSSRRKWRLRGFWAKCRPK